MSNNLFKQTNSIERYIEKNPKADNPKQYLSAGEQFIEELCRQALQAGKVLHFWYEEGLDNLHYKLK